MSDPMKKLTGDLNPKEARVADALDRAAQQIELNPNFQAALENRLKEAHRPKGVSIMPLKKSLPALAWAIALIAFAIALNWAIRSLAPKTIPGAGGTSTPASTYRTSEAPAPTAAGTASYPWRGTSLTLAVPLPDSPAEANVYLLNKDQPATLDEARALAARFGIQSEAYGTGYTFTDGKQMLSVQSRSEFIYTADIVKARNSEGSLNPNAEAIITEFLNSRGFYFPFKVEVDELRNAYTVRPISPDGFPMQYEYYASPVISVWLDENGNVLEVMANLMNYDPTPLGTFGILSADAALQKMLDDNVLVGKIESSVSASRPIKAWRRVYPANQTITIYGYKSSIPALDPNQPPFVQIDAYPVIGNIQGLAQLKGNGKQPESPYVEATGQFIIDNGIEKFNVENWRGPLGNVEYAWAGILNRENGQVSLTVDVLYDKEGGQYLLPDVPDNIPMPFENAFVVGTKVGNTIEWKLIDDRITANGGGGGGGGGGLGFYQLNLSGTPVPFPTATPVPTLASGGNYVVQAGDTVNSIAFANGITAYELMRTNGMSSPSQLTVGQTLLIPNAATPAPPPQLFIGTQKVAQINDQTVILFTTEDGKTYVQAGPDGDTNNAVLLGREGDKVSLDALVAPDKSFGGYPTLLVYGGGVGEGGGGGGGGSAENPPSTTNEPTAPAVPENYVPPTLTIEKVELVYFVSNPLYQANDPSASQRSPYIQPVWHFSGRYSNGDTFDMLIQALKQEFLKPEIAPYVQGG